MLRLSVRLSVCRMMRPQVRRAAGLSAVLLHYTDHNTSLSVTCEHRPVSCSQLT